MLIGYGIIALLFILILLGVPVGFSLGIAGATGLFALGFSQPTAIAQQTFSGLQSFPLVAIPMFLLMANLMDKGGITNALVGAVQALIGRLRGSLAVVTVGAAMFMGGISGSSLADTTSMGAVMIPALKREKYPAEFAAALTAAANMVGPIIPPSILMILYGLGTGQSVITLFFAGAIPGIAISLVYAVMGYVISRRRGYGLASAEVRRGFVSVGGELVRAVPAAAIPLVVLLGVLKGIFTVTESAAVVAGYALIYVCARAALVRKPPRELAHDLWQALVASYHDTAIVAFLIGGSALFSVALTLSGISQAMTSGIGAMGLSQGLLILLLIVIMLIMGTVLEPAASILIIASLFAPLVKANAIDGIQFGVIAVVALQVGTLTPPVGTSAYIVARFAGVPYERVIRALVPWLGVSIATLLLIAYVPQLSLWLPSVLGLT